VSDSRPPRDPGPDDVTVAAGGQHDTTREIEVDRVVTTDGPRLPDEVVPPPPLGTVDDPAGPRVVTENERVRVEDDGSVTRRVDRVEHEPPRRRRTSLVPALLIILALALGAIAAAWYFARTSTEPVPNVEGLSLDAAVSRLQDDGFKSDIVSEPNDAAEGTVFRQSPSGGSDADEGSTVQLLVSKGPADVNVPNTVGVSETDARDRLAAVGLTASVVKVFSDVDEGQVVAQDPAGGTSAAKSSTVRLNVSKGTRFVTVPSVVGSTQSDATTQVMAAGLKPNVVQVPSTQPAGTVVAQHPAGGQAQRGSFVRLNVSRGQ
jgi:serine/threonine-protein kinase